MADKRDGLQAFVHRFANQLFQGKNRHGFFQEIKITALLVADDPVGGYEVRGCNAGEGGHTHPHEAPIDGAEERPCVGYIP